MEFLPSMTSAMVAAVPSSDEPARFTGSCAAFTNRDVFLTAAHCAPPDQDLEVTALIEGGTARTVVDRAYHPSSDLALLLAEPFSQSGLNAALSNQVYRRYSTAVLEDGGEFICAGFPGELPSPQVRSTSPSAGSSADTSSAGSATPTRTRGTTSPSSSAAQPPPGSVGPSSPTPATPTSR